MQCRSSPAAAADGSGAPAQPVSTSPHVPYERLDSPRDRDALGPRARAVAGSPGRSGRAPPGARPRRSSTRGAARAKVGRRPAGTHAVARRSSGNARRRPRNKQSTALQPIPVLALGMPLAPLSQHPNGIVKRNASTSTAGRFTGINDADYPCCTYIIPPALRAWRAGTRVQPHRNVLKPAGVDRCVRAASGKYSRDAPAT
jgi:hypothetical protein